MKNAATPARPVQRPTARWPILEQRNGERTSRTDVLAREEPLEIRLRWGRAQGRRLALTMRTPGHDEELAAGLLYAEGIVRKRSEIKGFRFDPVPGEAQEFNSLVVELAGRPNVDWDEVARPLAMSSACGVCGRASLSFLRGQRPPRLNPRFPKVASRILQALPETLRAKQDVFATTGGLHAAALFDPDGTLLDVREDVGRHNALDKLVGHALMEGDLPLSRKVVLVSGRAGYEILQKAIRAGVGFVAAVGAPSSMAADAAKEFGVTLVGFLRPGRFNVYHAPERIET